MNLYEPFVSYPARLQAKYIKKKNKFFEFLEILKKLHINVSFANAIVKMFHYAKSMKKILTNKRQLENSKLFNIVKECNAIIQK